MKCNVIVRFIWYLKYYINKKKSPSKEKKKQTNQKKKEKKLAYLPIYVFEKTMASCYKRWDENKNIKLQMLALNETKTALF